MYPSGIPMAGTNQTLNPNMSAKHSSDRYIPQCVRSVSLYQRERLKNTPKQRSAAIITGTTFRPGQ